MRLPLTLCRELTLVKSVETVRLMKPLHCNAWSCECCALERKAKWFAQACSGEPTRFLTLTAGPRAGQTPEERLKALRRAWNVCVKRLRRLPKYKDLEYHVVVEATKAGEPHFHILLRSPYIAQAQISAAMSELAESPIVDIRVIKNTAKAVAYVAKYMMKGPARFGNSKRYWFSQNYQPENEYEPAPETLPGVPWRVAFNSVLELVDLWHREGWAGRPTSGEAWRFTPGQYLRGASP